MRQFGNGAFVWYVYWSDWGEENWTYDEWWAQWNTVHRNTFCGWWDKGRW